MGEKTELKKEQKKQKLLNAAYSLFLEKGVSKTSVDEIAKGANVAKGTFYLYFHDKEHLLQQLAYQISFRVLSEGYEFVNARQTKDFTENVILLIDYVIEYFKRNKLILRLIQRNFSWPIVERQLSLREDPLWDKLMTAVEQSGIAQGRTEDELFKLIFVILEMIGSTCYSSIIQGNPDTIDNMKPILYGLVRKMIG
ncbi:TetR/AcrR family transcriptional regulator [Neglectibacter caecimuris]|uniref:TetR/AcrR family transcriptional regulator n=1 Tax=Neglectibacter caecimuris TaxID=3093658 RepID=UPI002AC931A5|nr:TetR/AcrR family transcriptional regulator [Neglectibacter sp. M00184]